VAKHESEAREYTWLNNNLAVISDGSAVLGLGDIGPLGALPVMTGKAMIFKQFAGIDAIPIVLNVHSADEIVAAVKAIAPSFGAINLEDIAAPICFEVEERLKAELSIPVMHDDQHGTAVVTLAGLINATKVTGRSLHDSKIGIVGAGAAGVATAKLLYEYAQPDIIAVDSKGIISNSRTDLNTEKQKLLSFSKTDRDGTLADALQGADIFIGVSRPDLLQPAMVQSMAKNPIIFAMANPVPEIMPDVAKKAGAAVIATGRSDFPNQVNNSLAFPGIFRGALDNHVSTITDTHKIKAAEALAALVTNPSRDKIIPSPFDVGIVEAVANVIR
jgi:malate dehydrogenase (oxaloacetate-decarboxylating)